ncbi:hypothetical protein BC829DRAFT_402502 [Chytridium lagenaria]|nr:hypothetical protein BC829DRAFT_402502 [Chytridium lagenaria]
MSTNGLELAEAATTMKLEEPPASSPELGVTVDGDTVMKSPERSLMDCTPAPTSPQRSTPAVAWRSVMNDENMRRALSSSQAEGESKKRPGSPQEKPHFRRIFPNGQFVEPTIPQLCFKAESRTQPQCYVADGLYSHQGPLSSASGSGAPTRSDRPRRGGRPSPMTHGFRPPYQPGPQHQSSSGSFDPRSYPVQGPHGQLRHPLLSQQQQQEQQQQQQQLQSGPPGTLAYRSVMDLLNLYSMDNNNLPQSRQHLPGQPFPIRPPQGVSIGQGPSRQIYPSSGANAQGLSQQYIYSPQVSTTALATFKPTHSPQRNTEHVSPFTHSPQEVFKTSTARQQNHSYFSPLPSRNSIAPTNPPRSLNALARFASLVPQHSARLRKRAPKVFGLFRTPMRTIRLNKTRRNKISKTHLPFGTTMTIGPNGESIYQTADTTVVMDDAPSSSDAMAHVEPSLAPSASFVNTSPISTSSSKAWETDTSPILESVGKKRKNAPSGETTRTSTPVVTPAAKICKKMVRRVMTGTDCPSSLLRKKCPKKFIDRQVPNNAIDMTSGVPVIIGDPLIVNAKNKSRMHVHVFGMTSDQLTERVERQAVPRLTGPRTLASKGDTNNLGDMMSGAGADVCAWYELDHTEHDSAPSPAQQPPPSMGAPYGQTGISYSSPMSNAQTVEAVEEVRRRMPEFIPTSAKNTPYPHDADNGTSSRKPPSRAPATPITLSDIDEPGPSNRAGLLIHSLNLQTESEGKLRPNFDIRVVKVLTGWFDAHLDNPYPNQPAKELMARQTGLSIKQVNDWFINARRRRM